MYVEAIAAYRTCVKWHEIRVAIVAMRFCGPLYNLRKKNAFLSTFIDINVCCYFFLFILLTFLLSFLSAQLAFFLFLSLSLCECSCSVDACLCNIIKIVLLFYKTVRFFWLPNIVVQNPHPCTYGEYIIQFNWTHDNSLTLERIKQECITSHCYFFYILLSSSLIPSITF